MAPSPLSKRLGGGDGVDGDIFCVVLMVVSGLFCNCFLCSLGYFWWLLLVQFGCCFVAVFGVVWVLFLVLFGCRLGVV